MNKHIEQLKKTLNEIIEKHQGDTEAIDCETHTALMNYLTETGQLEVVELIEKTLTF